MKKWTACALIFALILCPMKIRAGESLSAQAAIVMEQSTGRVLYAANADAVLPMASTTKIMTALCVLENAALADTVTIDARMAGIEGSSMYLEVGETLTVEQLLYGLMLRSGNDAAVALALHVSGSVEDFVALMNQKAEELGLSHTHFANPHGLPAKEHCTTARELAIITCAAYENADFRRIVATQYVAVPWDGHPYDRAMKNKNKMLTLCEGGNGVKTGYTKAAGRCLVSGALRQGMQLVCVVLNAPDMWNDSLRLLDSGFENYSMTPVLDSLEPVAEIPCAFSDQTVPVLPLWDAAVPLKMDENAEITLELPENLTSGVARGEVLGYAMIGIKEMEPVRVPLIAGETVQPPQKLSYAQALRRVLTHWYPAQHEQEERKTA